MHHAFIGKSARQAEAEMAELRQNDPEEIFNADSVMRKIIEVSEDRGPRSLPAMSKHALKYYQGLEDVLGDQLMNIYIFPNHHYVDHTQPPQGSIVVVNPDAVLVPKLVSPKLGSVMLMSSVLNEESLPVTDDQTVEEYFRSKLGELNANIHQVAKDGISLFNSETKTSNLDGTGSLKDMYHWSAALGHSKGNFVNVMAADSEDQHGESKHYLAVKSDSALAGHQLKLWMDKQSQEKNITVRSFINSPFLAKTKNLSERNAQRLLADTANILKAKIATMPDHKAFKENEHYDVPLKAIPQFKNVTDDVVLHRLADGQEVALFLTQVTWTPAVKGGLLFGSEPTEGLIVYHTPRAFNNNVFGSFHNFTGHNPHYKKTTDEARDRKIRNRFKKIVVSEGTEGELNERLKGMYKQLSSADEKLHVQTLGAQYGKTELKLVMSKICSDTPIVH